MDGHAAGLKPFRAALDVEADRLRLGECFATTFADSGKMYEDVSAAVGRLYEVEALGLVEPFDGT